MKFEIVSEGCSQVGGDIADVVLIHQIYFEMESIAGRAATYSAVNVSVQQAMTSQPQKVTDLGHAS
jgi:hypothetical protein